MTDESERRLRPFRYDSTGRSVQVARAQDTALRQPTPAVGGSRRRTDVRRTGVRRLGGVARTPHGGTRDVKAVGVGAARAFG